MKTTARDLLLQMVNEETAVRGYLITRDRMSLGPFFAGRKGVTTDIATIEPIARGHATLQADLTRLRDEIRSLDGYFARQITFVADSPQGQLNARQAVLAATAQFNRFRRTAAALQAEAEHIVDQTRESQRQTYHQALAELIGAGAGALLIATFLLLRFPTRLRNLYVAEEQARVEAERGADAARALDHIAEAAVLIDAAGAIRFWNTRAEQLFGIPAEQATGRPASEIADLAAIEEATESGNALWPIQVQGEERWVATVSTKFEGGRVLAIRDVTDERALERTREEFVATAAHELRTPLSAVYGAAKTLLERGSELTEDTRERLMSLIEEETGHLTAIIDQLIATAQLDRGEVALEEDACDLPGLVESVLEAARARSPANIGFELHAPQRMQPVRCDETRVRQILVNLVENAVKYSPDGGRIAVRITERPTPAIAVSDEGLGIPPSEQGRIFEKFYRLDPEMARGIGGSGLGLYISQRLVEQMGGRISVDSQAGRGSTFTVELSQDALT